MQFYSKKVFVKCMQMLNGPSDGSHTNAMRGQSTAKDRGKVVEILLQGSLQQQRTSLSGIGLSYQRTSISAVAILLFEKFSISECKINGCSLKDTRMNGKFESGMAIPNSIENCQKCIAQTPNHRRCSKVKSLPPIAKQLLTLSKRGASLYLMQRPDLSSDVGEH